MDEMLFWIVAAVLAVLVVPAVAVSFNDVRLRRRHRALAGRRKVKMRL